MADFKYMVIILVAIYVLPLYLKTIVFKNILYKFVKLGVILADLSVILLIRIKTNVLRIEVIQEYTNLIHKVSK